jgi:hypothetical protein
VPSFNNIKHATLPVCPVNVFISWPVIVFQILIVLSPEPLANVPSFNNIKHLT